MKLAVRVVALLGVLLAATVPLVAGTKIVHRWVLTGVPVPQFHRMLVAGILENYLVRQEFEDQMKNLLAKYGVEGVQSYMVLPPKNEMMEGELRQRIKESSLDSVLVIRPKSVRQESQEVITGGVYVPPPGYYTFWPYWNMAYTDFAPTTSYTRQNIVVRVECNLYSTKDEKLVWSGETDTIYSKDFEKLAKQYAQTLVISSKKIKSCAKNDSPVSVAAPGSSLSCRAVPACVR